MHLMLVSETYPPEVNGVALTVQNLVHELRAAGHRVTLVRPRQAGESRQQSQPDLLIAGSLPIPRYPGLRFGLPAGRRIAQILRREAVDAVYIATEGPLGRSALRAARAAGLPVATGFHTRFDDYIRHYGLPWLERYALGWMRRFHNRASTTLVPTQELRSFLLQQGFRQVALLRRAVDTAQFDPRWRDPALRAALGADAKAPLVLFVGRIAAEKNLQLVLRAFDEVQALAPGARMIWVGDGPERPALMQRAPGQVYAGVLRGAELARYFASADLFLFPSLSETFGNVTLEAMASGLAVCAFDYGAAHEHIVQGESGYLAPFGAEADYLAQVRLATRHWLEGQRIGSAARRAVDQLSPRRVAEDLVQLYAGLAGSQRSAARHERSPDAAVHSTIL